MLYILWNNNHELKHELSSFLMIQILHDLPSISRNNALPGRDIGPTVAWLGPSRVSERLGEQKWVKQLINTNWWQIKEKYDNEKNWNSN